MPSAGLVYCNRPLKRIIVSQPTYPIFLSQAVVLNKPIFLRTEEDAKGATVMPDTLTFTAKPFQLRPMHELLAIRDCLGLVQLQQGGIIESVQCTQAVILLLLLDFRLEFVGHYLIGRLKRLFQLFMVLVDLL